MGAADTVDEAQRKAAHEADHLEKACDFAAASAAARRAHQFGRAARLAVLAGDERAVDEALHDLVQQRARGEALAVATDLAARGALAAAGRLLAMIGEELEAAALLARANLSAEAATLYEKAGRPADAARVLEAAIRAQHAPNALRLQLGRLLATHGRAEAAVKVLQEVDPTSAERASALALVAPLLSSLGLPVAAGEVRAELADLDPAPPAPTVALRVAEAPVARLLFGRYEVVREVSVTPNARVFEARDRLDGERVALKLLGASLAGTGRDAAQRFEREARALAHLRHPSICPLLAYLPEGPAMVFPWMAGGSLDERLREGPLTPARAVEIVSAVLSAIGEAHRLGILHRDIKPANVLFDGAGAAKIADFGAAHFGDLAKTATAGQIGTLAYMAPEQRLGRPATIASDIYAAGALLAQMLTGAMPKPAENGLLAHPPSASHAELGEAHDALLASFLSPAVASRPADAFEALRRIRALPWPDHLDPNHVVSLARRASERPPRDADERLERRGAPDEQGRELAWDRWLDRPVLLVPATAPELSRARAFACASHPLLPSIFRVDAAAATLWIGMPSGAPIDRDLAASELAQLEEALACLHAAGGAHGALDAAHIYEFSGAITLLYPRVGFDPEGLAVRDREAIERLRSTTR